MTDVVDQNKRSKMMSGIQGKNTKPEILVRSGLHRLGFRFRIHYSKLPGKPDIALPKYNALILVHGCFWHGHKCHLFKYPHTNPEFWKSKIQSNRARDARQRTHYEQQGWRTLVIWECALKGKHKLPFLSLLEVTRTWIEGDERDRDLSGLETEALRTKSSPVG